MNISFFYCINLYFFFIIILGCYIKKRKIPLPGFSQDTGPYYKLIDLVVGGNVIFYGKELKITGVDNYTRDFLNKMGIDVLENEPVPDDPYFIHRKKVKSYLFFQFGCVKSECHTIQLTFNSM